MNNYTSTLSKHVSWRHQIIMALALLLSSMPLALAGNCPSTPSQNQDLTGIGSYAEVPDYQRLERQEIFRLYQTKFSENYAGEVIEFYDPNTPLFRAVKVKDYRPGNSLFGNRRSFENPDVLPELLRKSSANSGGLASTPSAKAAFRFSMKQDEVLLVLDPAFVRADDQVEGMASMAIDLKEYGAHSVKVSKENEKWWPSGIPQRNIIGEILKNGEFIPNAHYEGTKGRQEILDLIMNDPNSGDIPENSVLAFALKFPNDFT